MTRLVVVTYNVRSLRDSSAAVVDVVRSCDPDLLCLQEVPRFLLWRRRLRALAAHCGLTVVAGGRPAAAVALLVRPGLPVRSAAARKLPWHPPRHRRGLACGIVEVAGTAVVVGSSHLSLDPAERVDQAARVLDLLTASGVPAVLGADVNEEPGGPAWGLLTDRLADAYAVAPEGPGATSPARGPRRRIDGVFVDHRLAVVACRVATAPPVADASDHCPVVATLEVG